MPSPYQWLRFGPFRLDRQQALLWQGNDRLPLRPQSLTVLQYLAERPGEVISARELLEQNWSETHVSETVLRVCIRDIRQVLQDTAANPQYVQTVRGQGYRFCGFVEYAGPAHETYTSPAAPSLLVGREQSLAQLRSAFHRAASGDPQVILVSGEAGMGKTTVIDAFLAQLPGSSPIAIGRGQCAEHVGPGEAYMPVLEALGRMGREPAGGRLVAALRQAAPTWLLHLPMLVPTSQPLEPQEPNTTPARMQREFADALALFASETTLVLVFEDLHWSDTATTDLLTYIARRREPGRLLVIGTYRPADLALENRPLHERLLDLSAQGLCQVHALPPLTVTDVEAYMSGRLNGPTAPELTPLLHQRSGGNPLFLANALTYLLEHEGVQKQHGRWTVPTEKLALVMDIPANVRQLISRQIDALPFKAQLILETASIAGDEFAVAAVAAVLSLPVEIAEVQCSLIARVGALLEAAGLATWPDGMVSSRYRFCHTLYRQVCYERLAPGQRVQYHRRIGERLALAYGDAVEQIVDELAFHFRQGQDGLRAVHYLQLAGQKALRRYAPEAAAQHCTMGLQLLQTLPSSPESTHYEFALQTTLGPAVLMTKGYPALEVHQTFARAQELAQQIGDHQQRFQGLSGLAGFYIVRGETDLAQDHMAQLRRLAQDQSDPLMLMNADFLLGVLRYYQGQFTESYTHLENALAHYQPALHDDIIATYGLDVGVACHAFLTNILTLLGYPGQALQHSQTALVWAQDFGHPLSHALALTIITNLYHDWGDTEEMATVASELMQLCQEYELGHFSAYSSIKQGWIEVHRGRPSKGLAEIRNGFELMQQSGSQAIKPRYVRYLAEVYQHLGQLAEGLQLVDATLQEVEQNGMRFYEAELYRCKGEFLRAMNSQHGSWTPEACFFHALEVARQQQAKWAELRAAMSLSHQWQQQGQRQQAHDVLAPVVNWFTEGLDSTEFQKAVVLLNQLR